jgi:hypothetical protein
MNKILIPLAAAGLLVAPIAGSLAAKPDKNATLTIAVAPNAVAFGTPANVTGAISSKQAGVALTLEAQAYPYKGGFTDAGTATTAADGTYTFAVTPAVSTHYRVSTSDKPTVRSPEAALAVSWKVGLGVSDKTPKKGQRVRFFGTVKPPSPNAKVYIQRYFAAGGWKTVKETTLTSSTPVASGYSVKLRVRKTGRYHAVVLGDGAHENGVSRARKLVVH